MRRALSLSAVLLLLWAGVLSAATYFVGQSAAGSEDGSSYSNRAAISTFNAGTAPFNDLAGDTVYFCGTITTGIVVPSGGSPGSPLVLRFDDETNPGLFDAATPIGLRIVSLDYIDIHGRGVGDDDIAIQNVTTSGISVEGTAGTAGDGHTIRVFDMYVYGTGNQAFQHRGTAQVYHSNIRGSNNVDDGFSMHDDTDCIVEDGLFEDNAEAFGTTDNAVLLTHRCKSVRSSSRAIGTDSNASHVHYDFESDSGEIGVWAGTGSIVINRFKITTSKLNVPGSLTMNYGVLISTQTGGTTDLCQLVSTDSIELNNVTIIGAGSRGIYGNTGFVSMTFRNTVFSGFGQYALRARVEVGTVTSSNNAFWDNDIDIFLSAGYLTADELGGADRITDDPKFIGGGDYHLTADSPLKGAGVAISGLHPTTDPDGVATATPPSIGAFEYVDEGGSSPKWNTITPAKWNGVDWENIKWNGM